jgi:hypothetical protein
VRPIGVQLGMTISHALQFIEHGGDVARHTQHVRPGCSGTTSFLARLRGFAEENADFGPVA